MKSDSKRLLPLLELTAILAIVAIGWAVLTLGRADRRVVEDYRAVETNAQAILRNQDETWKQYAIKLQHSFETEYNFKTHETARIRDEYANVVAYLDPAIEPLRNDLPAYVSGKPPEKRAAFKLKLSEFNSWIERNRDRAKLESFETKCQEIKAEMAGAKTAPSGVTNTIVRGLGSLLDEIRHAYSNCVAEADRGRELVEKNRPDLAQQRIEAATAYTDRLTDLSRQAKQDRTTIAAYLDSQPPLSYVELPRLDPAALSSATTLPGIATPLRKALKALIAAALILGLGAAFGLYRHFTVTPLRTKLQERDNMIQQTNQLDHFVRLTRELAHEIRNPLTAINARLYTLQRKLPPDTTEVADARVIQEEIKRLNQIVEEFLRLGSPAEPKLVEMSPEKFLRDVKELLQDDLERRGIELKLDPTVDLHFRADPQQLKQVLINLVRNAADSIEEKGTITLRARQDSAPLKGAIRDVVLLEVDDTGGGIPPEVQEKLFVPFFSTKPQGTGLGLSIAERIIDKHGGKLEFESELGKGTVFRIVLPLMPSETTHA